MSVEPETDELDVFSQRKRKLDALRKGGNAFPNDFKRRDLAKTLHDLHGYKEKSELVSEKTAVSVGGRIILRRLMGKASFVTLQDSTGRIQLYVRHDHLGDELYEKFKQWDLGDIVGGFGHLMKTNKGELSVEISEIRLLTKSLRPLPEKHKGLTDIEKRYRQRYLDLMVNESARRAFRLRSFVIEEIRKFFINKGFMEVETPMLMSQPGGASALPFKTYYNALDSDMYLRVAPELNLKRLVVGGFEKVFEINRNFRNEGVSSKHNPEFTMLEFYWAFSDYHDAMDLTEALLKGLVNLVSGSSSIEYDGVSLDFGRPFPRKSMSEAICEYNPEINPKELDQLSSIRSIAKKNNVLIEESWGVGKIVMELFESLVEDSIKQPTFIVDHPVEVSPLARRKEDDANLTERFELFVMGKEIANGFSELNDPEDQAERFLAQVRAKELGDLEAMHFDQDYITALEYGLPPTSGEGIGIDRLVMLLTNSLSIRDVLLFPHMRNKR
ncbi:MAG: lysine--tRNA ligase [Gammaproteobacteria bacterium]|nr:lysine--tRNA ligase [Gammaproteobacteria bacterium]